MKKNELLRLIFAAAITPCIPILALSVAYWNGTGSKVWFFIFFIFGYFFYLLVGLPVVAILLKRKKLISCVVAGGGVSVAPIFILSAFSLSSGNKIYTGEMVFNLSLLAVVGGIAGAIFWFLAFFKKNSESLL